MSVVSSNNALKSLKNVTQISFTRPLGGHGPSPYARYWIGHWATENSCEAFVIFPFFTSLVISLKPNLFILRLLPFFYFSGLWKMCDRYL
jgi:hypothetical protein